MRIALALCLLLPLGSHGRISNKKLLELSSNYASKFPNPLSNPADCHAVELVEGLGLCDVDNILLSQSKREIMSALNSISTAPVTLCQTTSSNEASHDEASHDRTEIALVLIDHFHHVPYALVPAQTDDDDNSYDRYVASASQLLAQELHNSFGVGSPAASCASTSNPSVTSGILVLVSLSERVIYLSVTAGLLPLLPQSRINRVIAAAKPSFRRGDYDAGILSLLATLEKQLTLPPPTASEKAWNSFIGALPVVLFLAFLGFVCYSSRAAGRRSQNLAAVRRELTKLEKDKAAAKAGAYKCSSCPICLEDFKSGEGGDAIGSDDVQVTLCRCGHVFDAGCFSDYLKSGAGTVCPICRDPLDGSKPPAATAPGVSFEENPGLHERQSNSSSYMHSSYMHYQPELDYRLNRVRRRYPGVMREEHVRRFSAVECESFAADPDFVVRRTERRETEGRSGRASGSRSGRGPSFGGGSSGGGGGGRW